MVDSELIDVYLVKYGLQVCNSIIENFSLVFFVLKARGFLIVFLIKFYDFQDEILLFFLKLTEFITGTSFENGIC